MSGTRQVSSSPSEDRFSVSRRASLRHAALLGCAALTPLAFAAPVALDDPRLLGTWRSDRELTMRYWRFESDAQDEQKQKFANLFGKITWRFTDDFTFRLDDEDVGFSTPYRVIAKDPVSVVLALGPEPEPRIQYIRFWEHYLVIPASAFNHEIFRRVAP